MKNTNIIRVVLNTKLVPSKVIGVDGVQREVTEADLAEIKELVNKGEVEVSKETRDGGYGKPIPATVTVVERLLLGGEVVGYTVKDGSGATARKKVSSMKEVVMGLKPTNFVVVEGANGCSLRGKPGLSLDDLPPRKLDHLVKKEKAKTKKSVGGDIVGLLQMTKHYGGKILRKPTSFYNAASGVSSDSTGFNRVSRVFEVAKPSIEVTKDKMAITLKFAVNGIVYLANGKTVSVKESRAKTLCQLEIVDGKIAKAESRIDTIYIAVPQREASAFFSEIGAKCGLEVVLDDEDMKSLEVALGKKNHVLYSVNLKGLPVALGDSSALLSVEKLGRLVEEKEKASYLTRYLGKVIKGLDGDKTNLYEISQSFSTLTQAELSELKEQGVDLKTGYYNEKSTYSSGGSKPEISLNVNYVSLNKLPSVPNSLAKLDYTVLDPSLVEEVKSSVGAAEGDEFKKALVDLSDRNKALAEKLNEELSLHEFALLAESKDLKVHEHDASVWGEKKELKNYTRYRNQENKVELQLKGVVVSE